jgi:hypothetical protein
MRSFSRLLATAVKRTKKEGSAPRTVKKKTETEDLSYVFNINDIDIDAFETEMVRCTEFLEVGMKNREALARLEDRLTSVNAELIAHMDVFSEVDDAKVILVDVLFFFGLKHRHRTRSGRNKAKPFSLFLTSS